MDIIKHDNSKISVDKTMKKVGLVGWRGMVGSVLMQRMREENDFALIEPVFFTTSIPGGKAPNFGKGSPR